MIIILGAEQRSFLTMERRGSLEISLPLSLSPCLSFSLYSWPRILFYISIISLFAAQSFLLLDPLLLLLVSALCSRKLSCSFCLSFVTEVCFWQFVENCIIPALSWRFYMNFLFWFSSLAPASFDILCLLKENYRLLLLQTIKFNWNLNVCGLCNCWGISECEGYFNNIYFTFNTIYVHGI